MPPTSPTRDPGDRIFMCFGGPLHGQRVALQPGQKSLRCLKPPAGPQTMFSAASEDPVDCDVVTYNIMPIIIQDSDRVHSVLMAPGVTLADVWEMAMAAFPPPREPGQPVEWVNPNRQQAVPPDQLLNRELERRFNVQRGALNYTGIELLEMLSANGWDLRARSLPGKEARAEAIGMLTDQGIAGVRAARERSCS